MTIAASIPIVQVSYHKFFPQYNPGTDVKPLTLHLFQVPIPAPASTYFDTSFLVPGAFYGVGTLIWVSEVDWYLVRVRPLIPCLLLAQVFNVRSET